MDVRPLMFALPLAGCVSLMEIYDVDQDGYIGSDDCDPANGQIHGVEDDAEDDAEDGAEDDAEDDADALELAGGINGLDDDCDGFIDEPFDVDHDGAYAPPYGEDCEDTLATVRPGADEIARNGLDDDCDGLGAVWPATIALDALVEDADVFVQILTPSGASGSKLGWSFAALGDVGEGEGEGAAEGEEDAPSQLADIALGAPALQPGGAVCLITGESLLEGGGQIALERCAIKGDQDAARGWGLAAGRFTGDEVVLAASVGGSTGSADEVTLYRDFATVGVSPVRDDLSALEDGSSVAMSREVLCNVGDLGGDGLDELFVGATSDEDGDDRWLVGVLYAGSTSGAGPTPRAVVLGENPGDGRAVAHAGDVDGDGLADMLVGLPDHGEGGTAYLIHGDAALDDVIARDQDLALELAATIFRGADGWRLGQAVETGSDLDGDGADDILIGAPGATNSFGVMGGAGLVFTEVQGGGLTLGPEDGLVYYNPVASTSAGMSVALPGDTDADGQADLLIGSAGSGASTEEQQLPDSVPVVWLLTDPVNRGGGSLAASDTIITFTSAPGTTWDVFAAGDMDFRLGSDAARVSGAEILIADQVSGTVFLFWGKGM